MCCRESEERVGRSIRRGGDSQRRKRKLYVGFYYEIDRDNGEAAVVL